MMLVWVVLQKGDYDYSYVPTNLAEFPAIVRWTGIDPVTHHSQSTYNAFNGNPVSIADPSGGDGFGGGVGGENFTSVFGMVISTPTNTGMYTGYAPNASFGSLYQRALGSNFGNNTVYASSLGDITSLMSAYGKVKAYHKPSVTYDGEHNTTDGGRLDTVNLGFWETISNFGNLSNTFAGYASFAGEALNHNWAGAKFTYGQRINGVVHTATALTNANRASSLLWASRFAKVGLVTNVVGVGYSANNLRNDYNKHGNGFKDVNSWDVADLSVGSVATLSGGASVAIAAGILNPASLGAAAFLVSNPVGWGIAIGATAYFTYRLLSD